MLRQRTIRGAAGLGLVGSLLSGCGLGPIAMDDRECMTRVMYFESNRSSEDGMLAVGTTVMNRLESRKFPKSVCGVVGQRNQFADGVLSKPMSPRLAARVARVADAVLAGARHPQVGEAMYFHTVGYVPPFNNMHYVAVAGGNAFYEKVSAPRQSSFFAAASPPQPNSLAFAAPRQETYVASAPAFTPAPEETTAPVPPLVAAEEERQAPRSMDQLIAETANATPTVGAPAQAEAVDDQGVY